MPGNDLINTSSQNNTTYYFWLFLLIHTLIWTIGPALTRASVPHDTLEGITWGLQWQLGYHKHPFLTAWLCAGITQLFGNVGWPVYLLAQLAVSTTFLAVWQLGKQMLPAMQALIATLILEGVFFYNLNSFNLTPDTLQSPLWALLCLFFYQAITTQKWSQWFYTAFFAALCLCTKYQIVILLVPMLLFCIINPEARRSFKKPGLYFALALFCLFITPHLVWLYHHDFITLTYAKKVSSDYTQNKTLINHLTYPLRFLVNNIINILGLFILLWPFYNPRKAPIKLGHFNWQYLLFIGFGPLFISLLLCLISGDYFPPRWSTPYFFAAGILAIAYLNPTLSTKNLKQFAVTLIIFSSLLFISRMSSLTLFPRPTSDAFLPNKKIALSLSKLWHEHYHSQLPYLAGSNYLVALITPYMPDKPTPYFSWDHNESPWIDEKKLLKQGGLFIWDEGQNYTWDRDSIIHTQLPPEVSGRFPELKILSNYTFYRLSDNQPIIIGVAILPPQS